MTIDQRLHGLSTLITTQDPTGSGQGSGFFYHVNGPKDPTKAEQWVAIEETWLVTNRHVVIPDEKLPDALTFHLRRIEGTSLAWEPITLEKAALSDRLLVHRNKDIDVCLVRVLDLLTDKIKSGTPYAAWHSVSSDNFAGQNKIHPHAGSDVVVLGYPRGYYDDVNLFPIVKAGIVASKWGAPFQGQPYFLVDAKLFPGSSGSIVISKPSDVAIENGRLFHAKDKVFAFLGIYSGEPYESHQPIDFEEFTLIRKTGFNVGIVWYAHVVEDIRLTGTPFTEA